ncbi:DEAD/DEAH box helicase [Corynebacterium nuruki]|uniref:DEAD/DEAH box helicase n=1 Tax=Corynebacterium nuruki TaxID=1032851 RepID=UPI0002485C79|nr:DEAD/DEAH box helicase family protein [Corynebacterium nuruki]
MNQPLSLVRDDTLIDAVASKFDLRTPNREALDATVTRISGGDFDPQNPLVLNLATGVGKTYIMGALIEYLRECGHTNIMVVTPGLVIQNKTIANFTRDSRKYIGGFDVPPQIITPDNMRAWGRTTNGQQGAFDSFIGSDVFIFNVQNLLAPKKADQATLGTTMEARRAKIRRFDENSGNLYAHLQSLDDLVIIADESHLYGSDAKAFNAALKELDPAATIGLTASAEPGDDIVYRYPLFRAITDRYIKRPVIVCRSKDYDKYPDSEERQLRDGLAVLRGKAAAYRRYALDHPEVTPVRPVMLVTCSDIDHATQITSLLAGVGYVGDCGKVLQVDSRHNDEQTRFQLENIDATDSTVEAVVAVGKLREGWDARNVAVIVSLRVSASEVLTQQTMGRGLRLPFKTYTDVDTINQLDIISHKSYRAYLASEDALKVFGIEKATDSSNPFVGPVIPEWTSPEDGRGADDSAWDTNGDATSAGTTDGVATGVHTGTTPGESGVSDTSGDDPLPPTPDEDAMSPVGFVELGENEEIPTPPPVPDPVKVTVNSKFAGEYFAFPASTMETKVAPFDLAEITDDQVRAAAKNVSTEGVVLNRELVETDGKKITLRDTTITTGGVDEVPDDQVVKTLTKVALGTNTFAQTNSNMAILGRRIITPFISAVGLSPWTEKALESGRKELQTLLRTAKKAFNANNTVADPEIKVQVLPIESEFTLPVDEQILPVEKPQQLRGRFATDRYYGPWKESGLFTAAMFDSLNAEYRLAYMLNKSDQIRWWKRLYFTDNARFAWSGGSRFYYPDFVVCDNAGNYWIIEAKSDSDVNDAEVLAKREAADKVMRKLTGDERFPDQWGYLFASEKDIAAVETWEGLIKRANPVTS